MSYAPRDNKHAHLRVDPSTDSPNASVNGIHDRAAGGARLLFTPFGKDDPTEVPGPGVICANKNNGNIRIVQAVADCKLSENHLDLGDLPDLTRIVALEKKVEAIETCIAYDAKRDQCFVGPGAADPSGPLITIRKDPSLITLNANAVQSVSDNMSLSASDIKLNVGLGSNPFSSISLSRSDGIDIQVSATETGNPNSIAISSAQDVDIRSSFGSINLADFEVAADTDVPAISIAPIFGGGTAISGGDVTIVSTKSGGDITIDAEFADLKLTAGGGIDIDAGVNDLKLMAGGGIETQSGSGCSGTCFDGLKTKVEAIEMCLAYDANQDACFVGPGAADESGPLIKLFGKLSSNKDLLVVSAPGAVQMASRHMSLSAALDITLNVGLGSNPFSSIALSTSDGIDIQVSATETGNPNSIAISSAQDVDIRSSFGSINLADFEVAADTDVPAISIAPIFGGGTAISGGDVTIVSTKSGGDITIDAEFADLKLTAGGGIDIDAGVNDLKLMAGGGIETQSGSGCSGTCFD